MEVILFTAVAAVLYLVSDRLLLLLEARAGRRFEYRSLVFFAILLVARGRDVRLRYRSSPPAADADVCLFCTALDLDQAQQFQVVNVAEQD